MTNINIKNGYYHYTVKFNDVEFIIDADLYLSAGDILEAIKEVFEDNFIDVSEINTITHIDIVNYSKEMYSGRNYG